ncbi:MAG TPA: hypothetical protein VJ672_13775 [Gemmatimonadaceae bacterium]|nr:hypothetical protein [Gemmatimonadaceae bacterium]
MSTRITPYELVLEPLETAAFPAIRAEAEARQADTRRRDQFVLLGHVGATLKEIVPDESTADAIEEYAELLFHGFQFWSFGRRLYVFDDAMTARLTAPMFEMPSWELAAPPAAYLQLPYQRVWARIESDAPYEPIDGAFVLVDETEPAPEAGAHLRVQLVLGVRPERPGLSLISYRTDLDPRAGVRRAVQPTRMDGTAFANVIPGGERMNYRTLVTTNELEALVLRALYVLDSETMRLEQRSGSSVEGESALDHVLVRG